FTSDGLGQQCLAGAWRADQQDALWQAAAEPAILGRALKEIDDFAYLVLGFVDPGNVGECYSGIRLDINLCLAPADCDQPAADAPARAETPADVPPYPEEQQDRHDPGQQISEERA